MMTATPTRPTIHAVQWLQIVASKSGGAAHYVRGFDNGAVTCDCKAFEFKGKCSHTVIGQAQEAREAAEYAAQHPAFDADGEFVGEIEDDENSEFGHSIEADEPCCQCCGSVRLSHPENTFCDACYSEFPGVAELVDDGPTPFDDEPVAVNWNSAPVAEAQPKRTAAATKARGEQALKDLFGEAA